MKPEFDAAAKESLEKGLIVTFGSIDVTESEELA